MPVARHISDFPKFGLDRAVEAAIEANHPAFSRGTLAIVTNVGRDAVDADGARDECAKSGRRSRVGPISRR